MKRTIRTALIGIAIGMVVWGVLAQSDQMNDPPAWPALARDMNDDELYTISDFQLQAKFLIFLPGNSAVKFFMGDENSMVSERRPRKLDGGLRFLRRQLRFLEVDSSWYFGWISLFMSILGWILVTFVLYSSYSWIVQVQRGSWKSYTKAGLKAYHQGNYPEAEKHLAAAVKEAEGFGPQDELLAASLQVLGLVYQDQGKYDEAELLNKRALAISEKAWGPEHSTVAAALNDLALLYNTQGKYAEAEPLHRRALAIYEKTEGPEHPDVAYSLHNLALLYYNQGNYTEAERLYKRALVIKEKALGPEHPDVAMSLKSLARLYYDQGKYAETEPLVKRVLAITEKALGPQHPDVAEILEYYAALLRETGRSAEAADMEARAKAIR